MDQKTPLIAFLPAALLLTIFSVQIVAAHSTVLSPWKGGGFGMFSTVDMDTKRVVALVVEVDGELLPAQIPLPVEQTVRALQAFPSNARLESLAHPLLHSAWTFTPDPALSPALHAALDSTDLRHDRTLVLAIDPDDPQAFHPDAIHITVYRQHFQASPDGGGQLSLTLLNDFSLRAHPPEDS